MMATKAIYILIKHERREEMYNILVPRLIAWD
jgi:hypothetical protein